MTSIPAATSMPTHHFTALLTRREAELCDTLRASVGAVADDVIDDTRDFKDLAAIDTRAAIDSITTEHASRELAQVRAALLRLRDGSYGWCEDCGDPIGEQRLEAMPATLYCCSCQAVHERPRFARR